MEVTEVCYPKEGLAYMNKDGPANRQFKIANGILLYKLKHDSRMPYVYEIPTHALVPSQESHQENPNPCCGPFGGSSNHVCQV